MMTQFGTAGLIALMWLHERRAAAQRERQINEAHEQIKESRTELNALLGALESNTKAMTALESGQRHLVGLIDTLRGIRRESQRDPQSDPPRTL